MLAAGVVVSYGDWEREKEAREEAYAEKRTRPCPSGDMHGRHVYRHHEQSWQCAGRDVPANGFGTLYDRATLIQVVIQHGRTDIKGCACGWAELGKSHGDHVADTYEQAIALLYPRGRR